MEIVKVSSQPKSHGNAHLTRRQYVKKHHTIAQPLPDLSLLLMTVKLSLSQILGTKISLNPQGEIMLNKQVKPFEKLVPVLKKISFIRT